VKRLLVGLAVAGGLAAAGLAAVPRNGGEPVGRSATVVRHTVTVRLAEYGEVEAREVRSVLAPITSDVSWVAEEGALVKAGDPVLAMSTEDLESRLEADRKTGVGIEGEVAKLRASAEAIEKSRAAAERRAALDLELARQALAEARSHPTPEEKKLAELNLESSKLRVERATDDEKSLADLAGKGYVTESRAKAARLDLVRARADLVRTEAASRETLAGSAPEHLRALEVAVKKAEMALAQAKFVAAADVAVARESLASAGTRLKLYREKLALTEKDIAGAKVAAPSAGVVALIDVYKGNPVMSPVEVGEQHTQGRELMKIAAVGTPRVRVHVSEADIVRVAVGQPAQVRLRSAPGKIWVARVAEIALFAEDKNRKLGSLALEKSGEAGVNSVDVLLDLEISAGADLPRLGSSADAEIVLATFENALAVPLSAVLWGPAGADPTVRVRRGGKIAAAPVKIAATTEGEAVVAEGLAEGEEILLDDGR
jgi:multidrug resistance efflux pump